MAYFWLNQYKESQGYSDVIGEVYNYRNNVPGHKKLSVGDRFVYYWPGEYLLFGAGTVDHIDSNNIASAPDTEALIEYYAHIDTYVEFDPPVEVRKIKDRISFLRGREGLRGVPQNSIYEISRDDFVTVLRVAGELGIFSDDA